MSSDCYKVEVLHYLHPHLIWVEVSDSSAAKKDDFVFEQVGIYGLLPLEHNLSVEGHDLSSRRCEKWVPAAAALMQKYLHDASEVYFTPVHIDRRSSIFDDNIHKYGDLIITQPNGKVRKLSRLLTKYGLAIKDECTFHQELSAGRIKTKLSNHRANDVIKEIEKFYLKKECTKKQWEKAVKKQTQVHHQAQNIQLTAETLEAHNRLASGGTHSAVDELVQMKLKDLQMCKDVEDVSAGRGISRPKTAKKDSPPPKQELSSALHKRKSLVKAVTNKTGHRTPLQMIQVTKHFLDANAVEQTVEDQVVESSNEEVIKETSNEAKIGKKDDRIETKYTYKEEPKKEECIETTYTYKEEPKIARKDNVSTKGKSPKSPNEGQNKGAPCARHVAFGPPGINLAKWTVKPVPVQSFEDTEPELRPENKVEVTSNTDDMNFNEDSDIEIEFNKIKPQTVEEKKTTIAKTPEKIDTELKSVKIIEVDDKIKHTQKDEPKSVSSTPTDTKKSRSGLYKRLQLHKASASKTRTFSSTSSETSNKDSSTSVEDAKPKKTTETRDQKSELDSDDDDISEVIEKLKLEYKIDEKLPKREEKELTKKTVPKSQVANNANPFNNDETIKSVFVEKLVKPVLMLHTKHDTRIQPTSVIRDIPFNTHIQIALKNMSVETPMMIQKVTWLSILRGYSTFIISPKGTGKTMGYLPAVCRLVADSNTEIQSKGPICIVVCATARSVSEVERNAKMFFGNKETVLACYTGMDEVALTTALLNGCHLLICTPAILYRLLQSDEFFDLSRLETFVLDDFERLSEVYQNEVKFFLCKIKEMLKKRIVKELKVQYVLASRTWCDFMKPLAKKAPDTVICIGAFQECVLYSKASTTAAFVTQDNKINSVLSFLEQIDSSKITVIVCRDDEEVRTLEAALKNTKQAVFATDNSGDVQTVARLSEAWNNYDDPANGRILVCCDASLHLMNVTDANYLVHYSLPGLFSMFRKRFAVLTDKYASIFREDNENVKIKILLDNSNVEKLPKILHFIKRCTNDVPKVLDEVSEKVLTEKDLLKAKNFVPICDNMLAFGECPDFWNCQDRHAIIKEFDQPKDWMPTEGLISFKILHYHNAVTYSARLLANSTKGQTKKFPLTFSTLTMKIAMYFAPESNRKLHGVPKVGDICAVAVRQNFFERCQVVKIMKRYQNGNPEYVLVKLLDKEKYERSRDVDLYHLPDEMARTETYVARVRLANIQPKDKDVTFSKLAEEHLMKITERDEDFYLRGEIVLVVGNCIFVNNLDTCRDLTTMKQTVVRHNFKDELAAHAIPNPDHIPKLTKVCESSQIPVLKKSFEEPEVPKPVTVLPKGSWAHLDGEEMPTVYFASAVNPGTFFVRLVKFADCMKGLIDDIQEHVAENNEILADPAKGDIVLARLPDDGMYDRARIEEVFESKVKCFFVDQGDWMEVEKKYIRPITPKFITQLPFQAIECRMIGVKPAGEDWADFGTSWFENYLDNKQLYVKYFKKESAEFTEGHKYAVAIIDTNSEKDVIVNDAMIEHNFASEDEDEIKYLDELNFANSAATKALTENSGSDLTADDDEWEKVSRNKTEQEEAETEAPKVPLEDIFPKKPIRSVPLVASDGESDIDDKWQMNPAGFEELFKPFAQQMKMNVPAIQSSKQPPKIIPADSDSVETSSLSDIQVIPSPQKINRTLDSDDLTSPDTTQVSEKMDDVLEVEELRKPRLCWRQDKSSIAIKILLIGVENYKLEIGVRSLEFSATHNDTQYGFKIDLYGVIDSKSASHSNKGQYILVNLNKISKSNWLTLAKDGQKKWIGYDHDHIEDSDDEISVIDDTQHILKSHFQQSDSESDDEFVDDANFKYSR